MISLCITTYNRYEMLLESFAQVLNDDRISEIVIVDDCSEPGIFGMIGKAIRSIDYSCKISLHRNNINLGMSRNKARAIELASNEWCILFDSDNVIGPDYLDAFFRAGAFHGAAFRNKDVVDKYFFHSDYIYCPSFAKPQFDYRKYEGYSTGLPYAKNLLRDPAGECLFNTCNYLVNREQYLKVYQHNPEMKGTDTIWFNYLWLKAGNSFYVVPGMEYFHRVHDGSGFMADCSYNMAKAKEVKELIKAL
jgi:glycosyltransferase involved in cell wall biosynthesis